jgi:signal transduction histidine kinase
MQPTTTGRTASPGPDARAWRSDTLAAMLTVGAVVTPLAALVSVVLRARPRSPLDSAVLLAAGATIVGLRFARSLSFAARAATTMAAIYGVGVYVLARTGLAPNVPILFALASLFGVVYFGRGVGYAANALGAAAFVAVGAAMASHHLVIPAGTDYDPDAFRNWVRVGTVYGLIASLLTSAIAFVIRRVEASARDLRVAYERLGQLHLRLESTKEEERRFLAHELHDELGQSLTALKLRLQRPASVGGPGPDDADPLAVIDDLIARVRRMSGDLRPPLLDEIGLVPAVRALLETQAALSGVAMTLEADDAAAGDGARLPPELEIACFRIVQEAVTNALRHAGARDLRVRIDRRPDRVALRVHDDGRGFDVAVRLDGAAAAGHLGVVGMRERARAHGGGFRLRSTPGAGTTIEVELPLAVGPGAHAAVPS